MDDRTADQTPLGRSDLFVYLGDDAAGAMEVKSTLAGVEVVVGGDRQRVVEEFSAFYRRFAARLAGWLIWQGVSVAEAKDVVQETMQKAYWRWASIENPEAWARKTASRAYAERVAKVDAIPVEDVAEQAADGCDLVAAADARQDIRAALQKLPMRQRQLLAWRFEGYEPAEIAEQLRMTPEAVRSSLYKARRKLDELLQARDEGDQ